MKTFLMRAIVATETLVLIMLAWQLVGCFGAGSFLAPSPETGYYPFPDTPDQLMANFAAAYAARDLEGYAATLHPDFVFVPAGRGADRAAHYSRERELRVAANMFSGQDREKDGVVIAAITSILFERCEALGTWETQDGVLRRTYDVHLRFVRDRGSDLTVDGQCTFTVVAVELVAPDDGIRRGYQILRQEDHTD